jgi:hypothetical protein
VTVFTHGELKQTAKGKVEAYFKVLQRYLPKWLMKGRKNIDQNSVYTGRQSRQAPPPYKKDSPVRTEPTGPADNCADTRRRREAVASFRKVFQLQRLSRTTATVIQNVGSLAEPEAGVSF